MLRLLEHRIHCDWKFSNFVQKFWYTCKYGRLWWQLFLPHDSARFVDVVNWFYSEWHWFWVPKLERLLYSSSKCRSSWSIGSTVTGNFQVLSKNCDNTHKYGCLWWQIFLPYEVWRCCKLVLFGMTLILSDKIGNAALLFFKMRWLLKHRIRCDWKFSHFFQKLCAIVNLMLQLTERHCISIFNLSIS